MSRYSIAIAFATVLLSSPLIAGEPSDISRVLPADQQPDDARVEQTRTLRDEYHPWKPPTTKQAWDTESTAIRKRVLVSNGLWPMPPKTPLNAVIHGKIERDDYTIEKVYFESHPGFYVTGNLYRPKGHSGKRPGVLSPHGHWSNGRFYDAGGNEAQRQIDQKAETYRSAARYPLQARAVHLARMGCVVFHYDMIGYADSKQIAHREGFKDAVAGLRLQNFMGVQTWNSIRALDFLLSLSDVDADRIGITGASGGGTQTFMLGAVDDRPDVAFPAVMVSTNMQGGCVCENAEYLRIGLNNIALAALFAPRPMALSGADDWTIDIETKGLPELKHVYSLYGKAPLVSAKAYPAFKHNYNQVSREMMYAWFKEHLRLPENMEIAERDFEPVAPSELSVFDEEHPLPKNAKSAAELREYLTAVSKSQFEKLIPRDKSDVAEYRRVIGGAAEVMLDAGVPGRDEIDGRLRDVKSLDGVRMYKGFLGRKKSGESIPTIVLAPDEPSGTGVVWIDGLGKRRLFDDANRPIPAVQKLLDAGVVVISADLYLTGEYLESNKKPNVSVDSNYHGYTFGYNRPLLSNRVRDILTVIGFAKRLAPGNIKTVQLVGTGDAGLWVLLARAVAGDDVDRTIADARNFQFSEKLEIDDPNYLPGALRYGGLPGLLSLAAPAKLHLFGWKETSEVKADPLTAFYKATGGGVQFSSESLNAGQVQTLLLKRPSPTE